MAKNTVRNGLILALPLIALTSLPTAAQASPRACRVLNLVPAFDRTVALARRAPADEQAQTLAALLARRLPDYYLVGGASPADLVKPAAAFLNGGVAIPGLPATVPPGEAAANVLARLPALATRFAAAFPEFRCTRPIAVGIALDRFDGVSPQGRGSGLLIGADLAWRIHGPDRLGALVHHELFHLYHRQVQPIAALIDPVPVWWGIWAEGLALAAAGAVDHSLDDDALFGYPRGAASAFAGRLPEAARAAAGAIDASGADYAPFFTANDAPAGLPPRAGYALGLDLVRGLLAEGATLPALARVPPARARALVAAYLQQQAAG